MLETIYKHKDLISHIFGILFWGFVITIFCSGVVSCFNYLGRESIRGQCELRGTEYQNGKLMERYMCNDGERLIERDEK